MTFAVAWACAAIERLLAVGLLGAQVPPPAPRAPATDRKLLQRARDYLGDPVTWTGLLFLFLKFPLGVATFVLWVTLIALSGSLIAAPFLYADWPPQIVLWEIDTLPEALACGAAGLLLLLTTLNLLNGVAAGWRRLAEALLGSRRVGPESA